MKTNQIINDEVFKPISTVSPEEILASGGATAYGIKTGNNSENLKKMLQKLPEPEPFTEEEWEELVRQLENDK